jgi:hypothetical protein
MLDFAGYAVRTAFRLAVPRFPDLCCVEATIVLQRVLEQLGYPARAVEGVFRLDKTVAEDPEDPEDPAEGLTLTYGHLWVEVDGTVVDITGDQFDPGLNHPWPGVYIGPRSDRYVGGLPVTDTAALESPACQAALFELRKLLPDWRPAKGPAGGLGAGDFTWWDLRNPQTLDSLMAHLFGLGERVAARVPELDFRALGRILPDENLAWLTWAPPKFGDAEAYRHRPHITLDVKPNELALHLNLELAKNADHFASLVHKDPDWVLTQARQLGCDLELQIYQRKEERVRRWILERPVFYPLTDLTPERLRQVVETAQQWGKQEGTRQAYFISRHIPAARAIAMGEGLAANLARRIEQLLPGLDAFDWKR